MSEWTDWLKLDGDKLIGADSVDVLKHNDCIEAVIAYKCSGEHYLDFVVILACEVHGSDGRRVEFLDEADVNDHPKPKLPTTPFATGDLKWDGCLNIYFDAQEHGMMHFCGLGNSLLMARMFDAIYKAGASMIESWDGDD